MWVDFPLAHHISYIPIQTQLYLLDLSFNDTQNHEVRK
jgi:hypothetical protein